MEVRTYQIGMREYSTESAARQLQEREAVRPAAVSANYLVAAGLIFC